MRPEEAVRSSVLDNLLILTERPYDEYNSILPQIKYQLETFDGQDRDLTFEQILAEELPLTTARRAYRTAIRIAMGQEKVFREYVPPRKPKKVKKESKNARPSTINPA
jgi:hypothetical protein